MSKIQQGTAPLWFKALKKVLYKFKIIATLQGGDTDNCWMIAFYKERDY